MKLGIIRLYAGKSGKVGYYNIQEIGLAKALAKRGISTDIFFLVDKSSNNEVVIETINEMVRIIYIPAMRIVNHGIVSPKFILDYKIDIVHLLSDNQLMVPRFIKFCDKNNIKIYNYIGAFESDSKNKIKKMFMDIITFRNIKCFRNSKVIVKTPTVKRQLEKLEVKDIKIIPVGLDLSIIPKICEDKMQLREELNIPKDKKVIIFVGRFEDYKNPLKALELINNINSKGEDYLLIMIGKGTLKSNVIREINRKKLDNNVILVDKIENFNIHKYYKVSDIFVNFNPNEIFGMSILEAMNQGCKSIAITAPGPNYIIKDKINGFIMKDFDMNNWSNVIKENIDNTKISELAIKRIKEEFDWDIIVDKYIDVFKEIKGD